jgi:hypothetical protein
LVEWWKDSMAAGEMGSFVRDPRIAGGRNGSENDGDMVFVEFYGLKIDVEFSF